MTTMHTKAASDQLICERERSLANSFVFLADTLVDDFDVVKLLDHLANVCVGLLDVQAAGLLLADAQGNLVIMATSSEQVRSIAALQLETRTGPSIEAADAGVVVAYADLSSDHPRWPVFEPAARAAGFGSVVVVPLRLRDQTIGSLSLLRTSSQRLSQSDERLAQAMADVATVGILAHRTAQRSDIVAQQLERALTSRVAIEQAKGVLAERSDMPLDDAFEAVRKYARNNNLKLTDAAQAVVRGELRPS